MVRVIASIKICSADVANFSCFMWIPGKFDWAKNWKQETALRYEIPRENWRQCLLLVRSALKVGQCARTWQRSRAKDASWPNAHCQPPIAVKIERRIAKEKILEQRRESLCWPGDNSLSDSWNAHSRTMLFGEWQFWRQLDRASNFGIRSLAFENTVGDIVFAFWKFATNPFKLLTPSVWAPLQNSATRSGKLVLVAFLLPNSRQNGAVKLAATPSQC